MPIILPVPLFAQEAAIHAPTMAEDRLAGCLAKAGTDPTTALAEASAWLKESKGTARALPQQCLGVIYSHLLRWDAAEQAFLAGQDAAAPTDNRTRSRLGVMAGNAALAAAEAQRALDHLDGAKALALAIPDTKAAGEIEIDRARALVQLDRTAEAEAALAIARRDDSQNALGWLLSATLSRRQNALATAQTQIETASALAPADPEVGLEAGVIAVLGGRDEAARKSWQSVIATSPDTPQARSAKGYLAQLEREKPKP